MTHTTLCEAAEYCHSEARLKCDFFFPTSLPLAFASHRVLSVTCMCALISREALVCVLCTQSLFQGCALGYVKKKKAEPQTCLSLRVKCLEESNLRKQVASI